MNKFLRHQQDGSLEIMLTGSAKDRRNQFRALQKKYAGYKITRQAESTSKYIDGQRIQVEEANVPQTIVRIVGVNTPVDKTEHNRKIVKTASLDKELE